MAVVEQKSYILPITRSETRKYSKASAIVVRSHNSRLNRTTATAAAQESIRANPFLARGVARRIGKSSSRMYERRGVRNPQVTVSLYRVKRQTSGKAAGRVTANNRVIASTHLTTRKAYRSYNRAHSITRRQANRNQARDSRGRFR